MKKGIYVIIGIIILIVASAYGVISQPEIDSDPASDESLGLSDNVTPVLEVGVSEEPEPEGRSLEVSVSDGVVAEEFP